MLVHRELKAIKFIFTCWRISYPRRGRFSSVFWIFWESIFSLFSQRESDGDGLCASNARNARVLTPARGSLDETISPGIDWESGFVPRALLGVLHVFGPVYIVSRPYANEPNMFRINWNVLMFSALSLAYHVRR